MNQDIQDMHDLRRQHFRAEFHLITDELYVVYGPYAISLHTDVEGNQWSITTHTKGFAVASKIDTDGAIAHALAVEHLQLIYGFLPPAVHHVSITYDKSPIDIAIQEHCFLSVVPGYRTYLVEFFDANRVMYVQESLSLHAPITPHPLRQGFTSLLRWLMGKSLSRSTYTYGSHQRRNSE